MAFIHPLGHLVTSDPLMITVWYHLSFELMFEGLVHPALETKMRQAYLMDREIHKDIDNAEIPVELFLTSKMTRREELKKMFAERKVRPLTLCEIATFAHHYSVMEMFAPGQQTHTQGLGTELAGTDRGKACSLTIAYCEMPKHLRKQTGSAAKELGFAPGTHGFGEGCYIAVTEIVP